MAKAYRVVAKLKNNRLWSAIRSEFPDVTTQSAAARALGCRPTEIGRLLNMTVWPCGRRGWWFSARTLATRLRETPDYLFEAALYGVAPGPIALELDRPALEAAGVFALVPGPEEALDRREREQAFDSRIAEAVSTLSPREQRVIRGRFGLETGEALTCAAMGAREGVGGARITQIERKALAKLRHPSRSRRLRSLGVV